MSKGWRHGVVGVDDADSEQTQVFYQTNRAEKLNVKYNKDLINKRRQKRKWKTIFCNSLKKLDHFCFDRDVAGDGHERANGFGLTYHQEIWNTFLEG